MDDDLTESVELEAYFSALHERFAVQADAPVSAGLAEFVDVIDLTPVSQPVAATSPTTSWRPKMLTGLGAFIATTTGKIVLGTTVAAASVGGMHAAEIVDVPLLPDQANAVVLVADSEEESTDSPEVEEAAAASEEEAVEAEELVETEAEESDAEEAEVDGDDEADDEEEPKNHGAVVSDFAKNTELEGCEKGQAISALAKSKEKKKDADSDDDEDESESEELVEEEEEEESSKCKSDDDKDGDDADHDEDDDDDEDDEDEDGDGPPEGKGHNRDDHPGKGNKADSDD
jgi:hypothetical protein